MAFHLRIWGRIKISLLWVIAREAAARGRYAKGLQKLEQIEAVGIGVPFPAEFGLLKAFVYTSTSQNDRALETLKLAYEHILSWRNYNEMERHYLTCYARIIYESAASKTSVESSLYNDLEAVRSADFGKVDLDQIKPHLKSNFPLRDHPDWK